MLNNASGKWKPPLLIFIYPSPSLHRQIPACSGYKNGDSDDIPGRYHRVGEIHIAKCHLIIRTVMTLPAEANGD